jgi:hypothetical protein
MDVALAGAAALAFTRTLVTARTHASPSGQMIDAHENAHVDADLGDQHRGNQPIDPWDLHQQRVLTAIWFELVVDTLVERRDVVLHNLESA